MTLPTKVLHVVNGEFYAGAERVQDLLALRLPERGYQVGFACLKDGIFADKRQSQDVPLHRCPMRTELDVRSALNVARLVKRDRYRLIHTHTRRAALVGQFASLIAGVPMVHHVHSPSDEDTEDGWRNLRNSVVEKMSLLRAAKLIPVSKSLENYLYRRGYKPHRVRTIVNGVSVQDKVRLRYTRDRALVVGTVALFRPRKGIEVLLKALAELRRRGVDARLHAVGPFETTAYQESIFRLVAELGLAEHVHWTGFTQNVTAEFQNMHLFALPSLFGEGMPMVVLEAMAVGLPVISTKVEGIPEVVRDGQDGLLVQPGNVEDMAQALRKFATGEVDAECLGDSGWQRQRENFSDSAMARRVAEVYGEVLGQ